MSAGCTGSTASWCPVHGTCACPYVDGWQDNGRTMDDPACPLHATGSAHGEDELPPAPHLLLVGLWTLASSTREGDPALAEALRAYRDNADRGELRAALRKAWPR